MFNIWNRVFKVSDLIFKDNSNYLKFKSKKLPQKIISKGMSISFDPSVKLPKKYVVQPYNDIDFFKLKTELGVFEIKTVIYKDRGKVYYNVHNLQTNIVFTLDEKAFKLLFRNESVPIDNAFKKKYLTTKS
jgi:hypothetical protein